MARFYCNENLEEGREVVLSSEESHHLSRVLRIESGEEIELVNGAGGLARAKVLDAGARNVRAEIVHLTQIMNRSRLRLCFGIPKAQAFEFIIRRVTEVGIFEFQPLETRYSLRLDSWNERRWEKILMEVAKQCEETHFPRILPPISLDAFLASTARPPTLVLCHEQARDARLELSSKQEGINVLVGAEGGWSPEETERILKAGALSLGLGGNRLRAETAALVSVTLLKSHLGEL